MMLKHLERVYGYAITLVIAQSYRLSVRSGDN